MSSVATPPQPPVDDLVVKWNKRTTRLSIALDILATFFVLSLVGGFFVIRWKLLVPTLWAALILMFLSIVPTEAQEVSGKPLSESDAKGFRMVADEFRATANELRHLTKGPTSENVAPLRIRSILERAHAALQKENESFMSSSRSPEQSESFHFIYEAASRRLDSYSSPNTQLNRVSEGLIACSDVFYSVAVNRSLSVRLDIKSYPSKASFTALAVQGYAHPVEGITPQTIELPLAAWRIRIKKEGFSDDNQAFDPFSGTQPNIIAILRPSQDEAIQRDRRHSAPVDLTSTQSEFFKKASVSLRNRANQAQAISHDAESSLRGVIDKATTDVVAVEIDFLQNANATQEQIDAARSFFDNIIQHHSEALRKLDQKETVSYGRVSLIRVGSETQESPAHLVEDTLRNTATAFESVSETSSLTLQIQIISYPPQATISYHLTGDSYELFGQLTTATLTLEWGVWYFRVELAGYESQEKRFDPYKDSSRAVAFTLNHKSASEPVK